MYSNTTTEGQRCCIFPSVYNLCACGQDLAVMVHPALAPNWCVYLSGKIFWINYHTLSFPLLRNHEKQIKMSERRIHWRSHVSFQSFQFHTIHKEQAFCSHCCVRNKDQFLSVAVSWTQCWLNIHTRKLQQLSSPELTQGCFCRGWLCLHLLSKWKFKLSTLLCYLISSPIPSPDFFSCLCGLGFLRAGFSTREWSKEHIQYLHPLCIIPGHPPQSAPSPLSSFFLLLLIYLRKPFLLSLKSLVTFNSKWMLAFLCASLNTLKTFLHSFQVASPFFPHSINCVLQFEFCQKLLAHPCRSPAGVHWNLFLEYWRSEICGL